MMLNDPLDTQVGERPVSNYPSLAATYVTVKSRVFWHSLNTTKLTKHVGPVKSSKDCILFCLGFLIGGGHHFEKSRHQPLHPGLEWPLGHTPVGPCSQLSHS